MTQGRSRKNRVDHMQMAGWLLTWGGVASAVLLVIAAFWG